MPAGASPARGDIALHVRDLHRRFRAGGTEVRAVDGVSIEIPAGRLTVVKGRSGSGKTTLLNILGLLDRPDAGALAYGQVDVLRMSDPDRDRFRRHEIGFVYQTIALVAAMSAAENVDFQMRVAGMKAAERSRRVSECLALVGLEKRMSHFPAEMSGGEQQRVAIARAIAHSPRVIYADEPTAELDTMTGVHIVAIFKRLIEEEGITVVMTTHDPAMMELADNVVEMDGGRVVEHVDDPL
ncbi:MAG: ABC transporter ATP-binding protein [Spirochaetaceae bacterium]|nr:MAG: ABC transporter ATP-binding protein [Spirochaetaceae bacterium]